MKKLIKKRWYAFLGTFLLLVGGIVALIIGGCMTGWDPITWIRSSYGTTFIILVILSLIGALWLWVLYKRSKLGGDDNDY